MIYLMPDWNLETTDFDRDGMLYVSRLFEKYGIDNQIILTNYQPFMQHYAQYFGVEMKQLFSTFDLMQDIQKTAGHPIGVQDLLYSPDIEKVFGNQELFLVKGNQLYGKVFFNMFGFVDSAVYFEENKRRVEIYDERGFIAQKVYYEDERLVKREYFNETATLTISEYLGENGKVVFEGGHRGEFDQKEYKNINMVLSEIIEKVVKTMNFQQDKLVLGISSDLLEIVDSMTKKEDFIYLISDINDLDVFQEIGWLDTILEKKHLVTEAAQKRNEIWERRAALDLPKGSIPVIGMQSATVDFGDSNTIREMIVYWRVGVWGKWADGAFEMMLKKMYKDPDVRLIIETGRNMNPMKLKEILLSFIDKNFNCKLEETELQEKIEQSKLTYTIEKRVFDIKEGIPDLRKVAEFLKALEIQQTPMAIQVKEIFRTVRLFVELAKVPDNFYHITALSRGIPILSYGQTAYFIDQKNGRIVQDMEDLQVGLDTYLDVLSPWNEALVTALDIIDANKEEKLISRWKNVLGIKEVAEVS